MPSTALNSPIALKRRIGVGAFVHRPLESHLADERKSRGVLNLRHSGAEHPRKVCTLYAVEILRDLEVLGHLFQACHRDISPQTEALQ